jgi:flagellin
MTALASHLNGITGVSDLGSFASTDSNADLTFTFNAANAGVQAATTIKSTGYTSNVSVTTAAIDGTAQSTAGVPGTTAVGDIYTLTVGSDTYATAAATATTQYNTNKEIAAGLQQTLTNEGITHFTIATVGGANFGNFVVTHAEEGNQGATTYSVTQTGGSGATDSTGVTISDGASKASDAIDAIDKALAKVASERATLGATQAQLESTVRNLANVAENTSAAAGRIMDTDYAAETANLTKAQILQQAATSILAQANAQPQAVLSLLQ